MTDLNEDFESWQLCWKIHTLFQEKEEIQERPFCPFCDSLHDEVGEENPSWPSESTVAVFAQRAASCSAGHAISGQSFMPPPPSAPLIPCASCSVDLVYNVSTAKQICWSSDCRRVMRVDKTAVREWPRKENGFALEEGELEKYLELVDEHNFFECLLCGDEVPLVDAPKRPPTNNCCHDPNVCLDCLSGNISADVTGGRWSNVKCPDPECRESLRGRDIHEFAEPDIARRYDEEMTRLNLSKNPAFRYCQNQEAKCSNGQIIGAAQDKVWSRRWVCSICKHVNCFDCTAATICEKHLRDTEQVANSKEVSRLAKRCPARDCGMAIMFEKGCNHMTCRKAEGGCGVVFCWHCKIIFPLRSGKPHYAHLATCPVKNGRIETGLVLPRPRVNDANYREGWDEDVGYEGLQPSKHWA